MTEWGDHETLTNATQAQCAAAQSWLQSLGPSLAPIGSNGLKRWLITLGNAVAGNADATVVMGKVAALCFAMADQPAYKFSEDALRAACLHFKWFPSASELNEFLARVNRERESQVFYAKRLAERGALANIRAAQ